MKDVTNLFNTYRECVRHLWNAYFRAVAVPTRNWDVRDEFDSVSRSIFTSLILHPLGVFDCELSPMSSTKPSALPNFRIVPNSKHGTPICINRVLPRSGYWDHPINRVRPKEVELHFLRFFEFDELGFRDYRYYEVSIAAAPKYPDIVGRAALIEAEFAKVLFTKPAA